MKIGKSARNVGTEQDSGKVVNDRLKSHWVQQKQNDLSKSNDKKNMVKPALTPVKGGTASNGTNQITDKETNQTTCNSQQSHQGPLCADNTPNGS